MKHEQLRTCINKLLLDLKRLSLYHIKSMERTAQYLKEEGNTAYEMGKYEEAIRMFTEAIDLDAENKTLYCNRSMAYAALSNWIKSAADARKAISLDDKYEKAYFRLTKAQVGAYTLCVLLFIIIILYFIDLPKEI